MKLRVAKDYVFWIKGSLSMIKGDLQDEKDVNYHWNFGSTARGV